MKRLNQQTFALHVGSKGFTVRNYPPSRRDVVSTAVEILLQMMILTAAEQVPNSSAYGATSVEIVRSPLHLKRGSLFDTATYVYRRVQRKIGRTNKTVLYIRIEVSHRGTVYGLGKCRRIANN